MTEHTNTPELRFPEFNEEWREFNLKDISTKKNKKNKNKLYNETFTNSAEYGIVSQKDYFDKEISNVRNLSNYYIVDPDDFVYNPRISRLAPVGPINRNKLNRIGVMSPLYTVFSTKLSIKSFLEYYFKTTKWHKFMKLNGDSGARSDRFTIKQSLFVKMPIVLPSEQEQEKIGKFFSKLDQQIELEEKKLELLEQQKKGYMQKIFSQQLRFKDEKGNDYPKWIFKKFEEIFKVVPSKKYQIKSSEIEDNASIPVIDQGQNLILGFSNNKEKVFNDFKNVIIYGDHTTVIKRSDKSFIIGGDGVKLLTSKVDSDISYLYNALQYFNVKSEGYKRHFSILKNKDFYISTSIEEQKRIANIFNKLDKYIEKQFAKVELLKQRKQGLLQKMFV
ncbi:restriction endonuclease subunit S [Staphylococcus epidermidis]|uniref:restriction endonuclease subunit S n=1 Tax=Staphylococcus epidermidis TaxID=1282 RepID=UPI000386C2AD|nr:restriction endonuclease subunit S [Staphylococcus epidermidis]EPZ43470.1 type I restriction modification DNA specificity domain protein [Staphylococcus epidermidis E13A]MBE9410208.1 restriction endonuclease subunit S [Staphylococcus epidermidis]MBF9299783.1 restriction endonuclease subunit S [Staphylococcus epidermidis]MBG3867086.1 restriction endonuclease subunit S [Staphylococcus epidermidis]